MFRRLLTIAVGGTLGVAILAIVTIRVGAMFGAGASLDAYLVGVSGPSLLLSLMSAVIISTLTPRLSVRGPHDAARRTGEWALLAFLVGAVLAGVIAVCRTRLITLLAPGLMTHSSKLAARVLAIYAVSLPATLAASVYSAYGFASNRSGPVGRRRAVWSDMARSSIHPHFHGIRHGSRDRLRYRVSGAAGFRVPILRQERASIPRRGGGRHLVHGSALAALGDRASTSRSESEHSPRSDAGSTLSDR